MKALSELHEALASHGLNPPEIVPDGTIQRFPTKDKGKDKDGYIAVFDHGEGIYGAFFGDWSTDLYQTWFSAKAKKLSKEERDKLKARMAKARKQAEADRKAEAEKAAEKASSIWTASRVTDLNDHAYLKAKQVPCYGLRLDKHGNLVVPVQNAGGKVTSLQFITPLGSKRFLSGGQVGGCCFSIPGKKEAFYLCEGYATGASIHQATGQTVICAFNAGNLKPVALAVRKRHPKAKIVIAADSDQWTDGNPGKAKGMEAAKAVKGLLALPMFKDEAEKPTDFNDLARLEGLQTVRVHLEEAKEPENKPAAKYFPFKIRPDGVHFLVEDKDGGITPVKVCTPLEVVAITHNEIHEQWGRLLKVTDLKGGVHFWAMPLRMTRGGREDFLEELYDMGLVAVPGRKAGDRIRLFISDHPTTKTVLCVERIGWHGDSFVLPEKAFSPSGTGNVVFQGTAREHSFRTKGTLPQWQDSLARYAVGNSRFALALSLGFTGPLLHLAGAESGGFHFMGDSSAGKSTLLLAASSVCGGGPAGYHRQWRTTDNALEAIASAHCDNLLCLDEMGQCEAKVVGETSYMLANGQGKQRMSKGAALKNAYTWRVVFLSTGEISCADKIQEDGRRLKAGQEVRVIDLPASPKSGHGVFEELHDFTTGAAMADHIRSFSSRYYGHALPAFLAELVTRQDEVRNFAGPFLAKFEAEACPGEVPGTVKRVCKRFGLVALAGALATKWKILPWPEDQAAKAAKTCFHDWLETRGGAASLDEIKGVEQVREFIQAHGSSRFETIGLDYEQKVINRAGFKRKDENGEWEYLIFPEVFKREVCRGLNWQKVCQVLKSMGAASPDANRNTKTVRITGGAKQRFVLVREEKL